MNLEWDVIENNTEQRAESVRWQFGDHDIRSGEQLSAVPYRLQRVMYCFAADLPNLTADE